MHNHRNFSLLMRLACLGIMIQLNSTILASESSKKASAGRQVMALRSKQEAFKCALSCVFEGYNMPVSNSQEKQSSKAVILAGLTLRKNILESEKSFKPECDLLRASSNPRCRTLVWMQTLLLADKNSDIAQEHAREMLKMCAQFGVLPAVCLDTQYVQVGKFIETVPESYKSCC